MKTGKKFLLFLAAIFVSNNLLQAQNYTKKWINQFGGEGWDQVEGLVCSNNSDSTYVTGCFQSELFAGSQSIQSAGMSDIYLACYDNTGKLLSLERGGGKDYDVASCMTIMNNNDLIICGLITDTITMGNLKSESLGERLFITKRTEANQYSWLTTLIPGSAYSSSLFLVDSDNNGNIYAAGCFMGTLTCQGYTLTSNGGTDIFIIKLSPDGIVMKFVSYGGSQNDVITAMSINPAGKIVIAGAAMSDFNIDHIMITADVHSGLSSDPFILCFNNDFSASWKTQINGSEYCTISGLDQDPEENIYASGSYNIQVNIGGSLYYSEGYSDAFLIKYDPNGNYDWSRSFGSWYYDYSKDLSVNQNGIAIVAGTMGATMQIDNILLFPPQTARNSAYLAEFSADGRAIWANCISGQGRIEGCEAEFDQNGNIYFTGDFNNSIETKTDTLISMGDYDLFLEFFFTCPEDYDEISGKDYVCPGLTVDLIIDESYTNILWSNEISDQHKITVDQPGLYGVEMTDPTGCTQRDSYEVTLAEPVAFSLGEDISLPVGNSFLINAPENFDNFVWQDGSSGTTYLATAEDNEPGFYSFWLSAKDLQGCLVHDTIEIEFYTETAVDNRANYELKVYPVPANEFLNLTYPAGGAGNDFNLQLIDLEGRIIITREIKNYVPGSVLQVDVNGITSGLYFIRVNKGKECFNLPIRISH